MRDVIGIWYREFGRSNAERADVASVFGETAWLRTVDGPRGMANVWTGGGGLILAFESMAQKKSQKAKKK